MNLLAGKLYDPGTAVNKVTTGVIAMTALDTTNLRLAFVVPPSGIVRVRLQGTLHGATTFPQIILGVLNGATVVGRVAPMTGGGNLAATTLQAVEAAFIVTGLTPGASLNYDAAYGVETLVAATGLKYGGPNNTVANDNFGGFAFEIWDPCPIYTPTSGTAPTAPVSARVDTNGTYIDTEVAAIKVKTDFLPSATAGTAGGVFIAGTNAATTITTGLTTTFTGNVTGSVGSVTGLTAANLDVAVSSRLATAGYTAPDNATVALIAGYTDSIESRLPAALVGGRMAANAEVVGDKTGYSLTTAPLDAAGTRTAVGLAAANLDTQLAALLPTASYTAPDNASITAIKAKTDSLNFTVAGQVNANIKYVNGVLVNGDGAATPWGP